MYKIFDVGRGSIKRHSDSHDHHEDFQNEESASINGVELCFECDVSLENTTV